MTNPTPAEVSRSYRQLHSWTKTGALYGLSVARIKKLVRQNARNEANLDKKKQ